MSKAVCSVSAFSRLRSPAYGTRRVSPPEAKRLARPTTHVYAMWLSTSTKSLSRGGDVLVWAGGSASSPCWPFFVYAPPPGQLPTRSQLWSFCSCCFSR